MKRLKILLGVSAALLVCASGAAQAAHVGVYIGGGGYYYPWGPAYYPYPPAVAVPVPVPVPAQPQEYVEQGQPGPAPVQGAAAGPSAGTWYYCDDSRTYYPYVKSCSSGWRPVPAQSQGPAN